jgi:hypothetical protein
VRSRSLNDRGATAAVQGAQRLAAVDFDRVGR